MSKQQTAQTVQRVGVGLLFLLVSVGVLYLLLFVPMPPDNEKPIMLVIGGIMTAGSMALMNLVQGGNEELAKREAMIQKLQSKLTAMEQRLDDRDNMIADLVDRLDPNAAERKPRRIEGPN